MEFCSYVLEGHNRKQVAVLLTMYVEKAFNATCDLFMFSQRGPVLQESRNDGQTYCEFINKYAA